MPPPTDPFNLVKEDIKSSVSSCRGSVWLECTSAALTRPLLQLAKAKEGYAKWQGLSRSSPDLGSVRADVEDECKSIAWQVQAAKHSKCMCCSTCPSRLQAWQHSLAFAGAA